MATTNSGTKGPWDDLPRLSKANQRMWFKTFLTLCLADDKDMVLLQTPAEYAAVDHPAPLGDGILWREDKISPTKILWWNGTLEKEYKKAAAWVLTRLVWKGPVLEKQKLLEDFDTIKDAWEYLKKKYTKVTMEEGTASVRKLTTFEYNAKCNVEENWMKIHEYRTIAQSFSKDTKYGDDFLYTIFLKSLPEEFDKYKAGIIAASGDAEEKIALLQGAWEQMDSGKKPKAKTKETIEVGFHASTPYDKQAGWNSEEELITALAANGNMECYYCAGSHRAMYCPIRTKVARAGRRLREELIAKGKWNEPSALPNRGRGSSSWRQNDSKGRDFSSESKPKSRSPSRVRFPSKGGSDPRSDSRDSRRPHKSSRSSSKAYSADEISQSTTTGSSGDSGSNVSDDSIDEVAGVSWEQRREIPPSVWISDSGCTTPMTDKLELFSSPLTPCRRGIKVGGGRLESQSKGTVEIKTQDGRSFFFLDALFVPTLGCNLLSTSKLLGDNELVGKFDKQRMTFSPPHHKPIIEATKERGVYVVSKIARAANGKTFGGKSTAEVLPSRVSRGLPSRTDKYPNSMIFPIHPPKSSLRKETAYPTTDIPTVVLPSNDDEFKTVVKRNTKANSRLPAREEPLSPLETSNRFTVLEPKSDGPPPILSKEPYAEITEKRGLYPQISRSQRNAIVRAVRKEDRETQGSEESDKRNPWTLKAKKDQRILDRYVYYHRTFCHASSKAISLLHTVTDIKRVEIPEKVPLCEVCARSKIRKIRSKQLADHKNEPLALISFDVAGPFPTSYRGFKYLGIVLDNWSRKEWLLLFKDRTEVLPGLRKWKIKAEAESGYKLRAARTDNAPEILETLQEWEKTDGVIAQTTEAYTSHQNGPAERAIQSNENSVRALLDDSELPVEFWCEASTCHTYLRNRMRRGPVVVETLKEDSKEGPKGCRVEYQVSPEEAWTGNMPICDNRLKPWGCKVIAHISPKSHPAGTRADKFMATGRDGIFMGYDENTTKHYRIYAPDRHCTVISSTVRFFPDTKGGSIDNFQLWMEDSDGKFEQTEGRYNTPILRKRRGRPPKAKDVVLEEGIQTSDATDVPLFMSPAFRSSTATTPSTPKMPVLGKSKSSRKATVEDEDTSTHKVVSDEELARAKSKGLPQVIIPTYDPSPTAEKRRSTEDISTPELKRSKNYDSRTPEVQMRELTHHPESLAGGMVLRSGLTTRKRDEPSTPRAANEEPEAKRIRAMISILNWFEDEDILTEEEEIAMFSFATKVNIPIPKTYKEAVNDPKYAKQWKEAIQQEIGQLLVNNTWKEGTPPEGANLISTKWVFTLKFNVDGTLERFKARLVARGFSQAYGIDYTETFAPTVRMATLRAFLAIVACENLECEHYDIKNAFTESRLKEELWMQIPDGIHAKRGHALRLLRSLYGLKQAARDWNLLFKNELLGWGFEQSKADPCLYVHQQRGIRLLVYVDDIVAAAESKSDLNWFWTQLSERFEAKNLRDVKQILGIRVTRDRKNRTLELDQELYLDKVLSKFGFKRSKSREVSTPMDGYHDIQPATDKDERIDQTWYREVIGSLMYAMVYTRPDIAFALGRLSQFMQDPAKQHERGLKRLMRYLRRTITLRVRFGLVSKDATKELEVYSDADWAQDKTDRKSVSACLGLIGAGPIFYGSKKQTSVATATTESEYIAMSTTAKQGQWIAQILRDIGYPEYVSKNGMTVATFGDNQGAIALAKNPHLTERSKHIDISYHYIRDLQERERVDIKYVPTDKMAADGLTKPLTKGPFERFKRMIGMTNPRDKDSSR